MNLRLSWRNNHTVGHPLTADGVALFQCTIQDIGHQPIRYHRLRASGTTTGDMHQGCVRESGCEGSKHRKGLLWTFWNTGKTREQLIKLPRHHNPSYDDVDSLYKQAEANANTLKSPSEEFLFGGCLCTEQLGISYPGNSSIGRDSSIRQTRPGRLSLRPKHAQYRFSTCCSSRGIAQCAHRPVSPHETTLTRVAALLAPGYIQGHWLYC